MSDHGVEVICESVVSIAVLLFFWLIGRDRK
jgi:hypothetical protein